MGWVLFIVPLFSWQFADLPKAIPNRTNAEKTLIRWVGWFTLETVCFYPLVNVYIAIENGPVEIVDFPINSMVDLSSSAFCRFTRGYIYIYCFVFFHLPYLKWWLPIKNGDLPEGSLWIGALTRNWFMSSPGRRWRMVILQEKKT